MSGIKYLIDTCTLIGLDKQTSERLDLFYKNNVKISECAISLITYIEFIGFHHADKKMIDHFKMVAQLFTYYPISDEIRDLMIDIRIRHKIKLPDALILATAKMHNLQLLTLDEKLQRIRDQLEKE